MGPCRRVASRVRISATLREFTDHALQMAAHGQPGRVAIARHQRGEDALMVFLRGLAQFLRVEVLLDFFPDGAARLVPHGCHGGLQHAVTGGLRDVQVKAPVGLFVGDLVHHLLAHGAQGLEHAVQVRVLAGGGGQPCDFGFDQAARAQQFERAGAGLLRHGQARHARLGLADIDARSAAHLDHALQLQRDDGFAQRGAADIEALGQRALGRQALADREFSLDHQGLDLGGQTQIGAVQSRLLRGLFGLGDQLQAS